MTKDELREAARAQRRALTKEETAVLSRAITKNVLGLDAYKRAKTVMIYLSSFNEPSSDELLKRLYEDKKRVVVPVSNTDSFTIIPSLLPSPDSLIKGAYGIPEPKDIIKAQVSDIDLALIPGIVFDTSGARIGFGKGYYDRFLAEFEGVKAGICYDFQLHENIPVSEHDVRMDLIITEKRIYNDF